MKALIGKHLPNAIAFGAIMTVIGFFRGEAVFTFPPIWRELARLFLIYAITFLAVSVLFDWIAQKFKRD